MARGKHKRAKANRDAQALADDIAAAKRELAEEQAKLAEAEQVAAEVDALRDDLTHILAEREANVIPQKERLTSQSVVLTELLGEIQQTDRAIHGAWNLVTDELIQRFGGGREGFEVLMEVVNGRRITLTDPFQNTLSPEQVQRLQLARGQRRMLQKIKPPDQSTLIEVQPRRRWLKVYEDVGIAGLTGAERASRVAELQPEEREKVAEADRASAEIFGCCVGSLGLDAITFWHPLPCVVLGEQGSTPGSAITDLGADGIDLPRDEPLLASSSAPTPVLTAGGRASTAKGTVEAFHAVAVDALERDLTVVHAAKRLKCPWEPLPAFPVPGDAVGIRLWYTMAAMGGWARLSDAVEAGEGRARDRDAYGQAAAGLASAVPFWLPAGQAHGYADSEPLRAEDLADVRLPFPQVLVTLADPLHLPPRRQSVMDEQELLAELDAVILRMLQTQDPQDKTAREFLQEAVDPAIWKVVPPVPQTLELRGANVEGVLLLGGALGNLADEFAWCLAIPSNSGGVLARIVVPAKRSQTRWASVVENLAAATAWADWHEADQELGEISTSRQAKQVSRLSSFRRLYPRGGASGVRVLNVKRTSGGGARSGDGRTLSPHVRRGHWRRQHHGPGRSLVKRVRIAPVLVNAGLSGLAPRVYRLPLGEGKRTTQ